MGVGRENVADGLDVGPPLEGNSAAGESGGAGTETEEESEEGEMGSAAVRGKGGGVSAGDG